MKLCPPLLEVSVITNELLDLLVDGLLDLGRECGRLQLLSDSLLDGFLHRVNVQIVD